MPKAVEPVSDSSRYFVIRIINGGGGCVVLCCVVLCCVVLCCVVLCSRYFVIRITNGGGGLCCLVLSCVVLCCVLLFCFVCLFGYFLSPSLSPSLIPLQLLQANTPSSALDLRSDQTRLTSTLQSAIISSDFFSPRLFLCASHLFSSYLLKKPPTSSRRREQSAVKSNEPYVPKHDIGGFKEGQTIRLNIKVLRFIYLFIRFFLFIYLFYLLAQKNDDGSTPAAAAAAPAKPKPASGGGPAIHTDIFIPSFFLLLLLLLLLFGYTLVHRLFY